jgi:hypothetical protein
MLAQLARYALPQPWCPQSVGPIAGRHNQVSKSA